MRHLLLLPILSLLFFAPLTAAADGMPEDEAGTEEAAAAPEAEADVEAAPEPEAEAEPEPESDSEPEAEAGDEEGDGNEASEAEAAPEAEKKTGRPGPWLWTRGAVAVSGWPAGLILDTKAEARVALHRSKSIVFQDTMAGIGLRFAVTPAFVDVGPRLTLAPIDVFDIEVQGGWVGVWPSSSGLMPYPDLDTSKRDKVRSARQDDEATRSRSGQYWYLTASPTLKLKVGPIIALDSWSFTWTKMQPHPDETASLFYEPYRDLLLERDDLIIEHQAALLYEVHPGKGGPLLLVGATFQDRMVDGSGDRNMALGALVIFKPFDDPKWPKFVGLALPYLKYEERVGHASMAFLVAWSHDFEFGKKSSEKEAAMALRTLSRLR